MKKPAFGAKRPSDRGGPPGKIPAGIGKPAIKAKSLPAMPLHPKRPAGDKMPMLKLKNGGKAGKGMC